MENTLEILRVSEYINVDGVLVEKERITLESKVEDLFGIYKDLKDRGLAIDHFYDF